MPALGLTLGLALAACGNIQRVPEGTVGTTVAGANTGTPKPTARPGPKAPEIAVRAPSVADAKKAAATGTKASVKPTPKDAAAAADAKAAATPTPPPPPPAAPLPERYDAAVALLKAHKYKDAQARFDALLKDAGPNDSGPLTNLGILEARAKERDAAFRSFSSAVGKNPRNAVAHNWLGVMYREGNNYPEAEASYRRALAAKPGDPDATLNLAILYDVYLKRPTDALTYYRAYQATQSTPDLRVAGWIAAIEQAQNPPPAEVPLGAQPVPTPAPAPAPAPATAPPPAARGTP